VAFREDHSRIRSENGAQNFALLRRITFNALRREKTEKGGLRTKQKRCGWDHDYLFSVLRLMTADELAAPS